MKIGLGLITYNRRNFFEASYATAHDALDRKHVNRLVIVNDGTPYEGFVLKKQKHAQLIQRETNGGVACAKNDAFRHLMNEGCDVVFLMEDDIVIKNGMIFSKYCNAMEYSGIHHFNFGYHGPANVFQGRPNPQLIIRYSESDNIAFNRHCVGAFSMYSKECIERVGLMDESFVNAWEHIDHTLRIIKAGFHPPFWWFSDLKESADYLGEIASSEVSSTIRERPDWRRNINRGAEHFIQLHGCIPTHIPDAGRAAVLQYLKTVKR